MREIKKIIIHCSDTPDDANVVAKEVYFRTYSLLNNQEKRNIEMRINKSIFDVDQWHMERGFTKQKSGWFCGYHYVICRNGLIQTGRDIGEVGAHCEGHNQDSIGICLIGKNNYTTLQYDAIYCLIERLLMLYNVEPSQVFGHREFDKHGKTCPGIQDLDKLRSEIEHNYNKGLKNGPTGLS